MRREVFVLFPNDWRGRIAEIWPNGDVTLDSGLISKERKERGESPVHTRVIGPTDTSEDIDRWLTSHGAR